ncbi:MAG: cbb3-type cytochrome oxidase assembly protein CcoS [Gemmatimonadota bacterium]
MLPSSFAVIGVALLLGGLALVAFAWGWRRGHFDGLREQAYLVFDERDLRLERPWETEAQQERRAARHGPPLDPAPGEWGGAE